MKLNPSFMVSNKEIQNMLIEVCGVSMPFPYPRDRNLSQFVYLSNID